MSEELEGFSAHNECEDFYVDVKDDKAYITIDVYNRAESSVNTVGFAMTPIQWTKFKEWVNA